MRKTRCMECRHCVGLGSGDYMCDADGVRIVVKNYLPTREHMWCKGRREDLYNE